MATTREWIEIWMVGIMALGLIGGLWNRHKQRTGIGVRFIQYLAVVFLGPVFVILAFEKVLSSEATATILGAFVGYVLSGIGKDEPPKT